MQELKAHFVKLIAPDHFRQNWLESHYKALVETTLRKIDPAIEGYKVSIANVDRKIEIPQLNLQAVPLPKSLKSLTPKKNLLHFTVII